MKLSFITIFIVLILTIAMIISYDQNPNVKAQEVASPSTQGLMAWWKLNEGNGSTVFDSSGNNLDGTINGCTWVNSEGFSSLSFNGQSDYVNLPPFNLTNLNSLTVTSWVNSNLSKVGFIIYHGNLGEFEMGNGDLSEETQSLNLNSTLASFSVKLSDSNWYRVSSPIPMQPNTWHQIVGSWVKGTSLKVYVDGVLAAENDTIENFGLFDPWSYFQNSLGVYAQNNWGNIDFFSGQMSNIMIYNKALDGNEIQTLYTIQNPSSNSIPTPTSIQTPNPNIFNVQSNSTVTALTFDSEKQEFSFNVTGESGTTGSTNVTIAKSFLPNIDNLKVYLDNNQINFNVSSVDDSWFLTFTYSHSTHQVKIDLNAKEAPSSITLAGWIVAIILVATVLAVLVALVYRRKAATNKTQNPPLTS